MNSDAQITAACRTVPPATITPLTSGKPQRHHTLSFLVLQVDSQWHTSPQRGHWPSHAVEAPPGMLLCWAQKPATEAT